MSYIRDHVGDLRDLYRENDLTSERLIKSPSALGAFAREFNSRIGASFSTIEIASELERIRKDKGGTGGLPRLGRRTSGPKFR
jgi:hypothetical protein